MIIILEKPKPFLIVLLVSALFQISIAFLPSVGDAHIYSQWMRALTKEGLASAYWDKPIASEQDTEAYYRIDYPPLYPYLLYAQGVLLESLTSQSFLENDRLVRFWVKIPIIAGNLLISFLIYRMVRRKKGEEKAVLSASAYAFNPAILYISCYWGQSDSLCAASLLLSVLWLSESKPELSWFFVTLAAFTKPVAYPFAAVLLFVTGWRFGWKRLLPCLLVSVATAWVILLPFLVIGRFSAIVGDLFFQIDAMPWISANAHNLWWIVSGGLPWVNSNTRIAGPISYKAVGIAFYTAFLAITLWKDRLSSNPDTDYFLFASTAFGLFVLSTHMHAYHLFYALVFVSILVVNISRLRIFYALLTIASFTNMVLYDIHFIYLTKIGMYLTMLNSQLCLGIFVLWLAAFYREKNFDAVFETKPLRPSPAKLFMLGLPAIFLTAGPFVQKASTFHIEHYLLTQFNSALKRAPSEDFIRKEIFMIHNDLRPVIFQHPPSEITYEFKIPSRTVLSFGICLSPAVWNPQKGDGVLFEIHVQDQADTEVIFHKYIDPKSIPSDRRWHDETVDLSKYGGKEVQLVLSVHPGPFDDNRYDWAAWSDPRIISSAPPSFLQFK